MKKTQIIKIISLIIWAALLYYFMLPPINISSPVFWIYIFFVVGTIIFVNAITSVRISGNEIITVRPAIGKASKIILIALGAIFILLILVNIINAPLFNSKAYYDRIKINENANFSTDITEVDFSKMPLLDKASSSKVGDRVMGQMTDLVSQFYVSNLYTQINYNNKIVRVTPLEYADWIKFFTNRSKGIEGYIIVNSVTGESELVRLEDGMKFAPSAMFFENLDRILRIQYPTEIFGEINFEIDNEGNPYWIVSTINYVGIGLRPEVSGAIIFNPITGESQKYNVKDIPSWVDHVYPSELIIDQTNDWGLYKNGFFNSIFGQKEVVTTTSGYNYTVMNDDVYLYTGITSVVSDESNLGFILSNLRTKETVFYEVPGAEEYSAMDSAEGQVQQMHYNATFPLLINLNNKPTYFLSLKDNAGLVKMYAFIDVQNYQKVVVTDSSKGIETAAKNYLAGEEIIINEEKLITKTITIKTIKAVVIDGTTYYYITDTENNHYRAPIKIAEERLPFIENEVNINISYTNGEKINEIVKIVE